ncbi:ATPase [Nostoc piscinale CENA21]|uniref:ATPase n=1 Tax=Nostoc piscinale CENA21 TaxID=224013 RepID=A0A0M4SW64_9NOSO|nr:ATP-binding protein [Nostoc piscinale]ALF52896.1 ATPase [Nostoc piscinale CENA21]
MKPHAPSWSIINHRYLMAALAEVHHCLKIYAQQESTTTPPPDLPETLPALEILCRVFKLSPFERQLLLLCAGIELEPEFASLVVTLINRSAPTFQLALAALPQAHWDALTPTAPLRHWRLIYIETGETLVTSSLRIDERILHYLMGVAYLDQKLYGLVTSIVTKVNLPPSHQATVDQIQQLWKQRRSPLYPIINLCGANMSSHEAIAATTCQSLGIRLYSLNAADIPTDVTERETLRILWEREAILSGSALLIDASDTGDHNQQRTLISFLQSFTSMGFVASREPLSLRRRTIVRFDVNRPNADEQEALWQRALGDATSSLNGQLAQIVSQFNLEPEGIQQASDLVLQQTTSSASFSHQLWQTCRQQVRTQLDDLAQRIEPVAKWMDLILPEPQKQTLREIVVSVQQRSQVYQIWGFGNHSQRGLGITTLFAGGSGTGKTMAAEILAQELQLDLYRIDLSSVVSKYIGETEKNLRRIFDAAEAGGVILLFDEADALFGKRSEVKDAHDRHANIEVSYLLQRMESYGGLAILTTNFKHAIDVAFLRRIRFVIPFPFPDVSQRLEIWQRMFPPQTPVADLDFAKLARLNVAGGNIRNIALNAAFLAAAEQQPVQMRHILRAAHSEYAKLEKPLADAEVRGWI